MYLQQNMDLHPYQSKAAFASILAWWLILYRWRAACHPFIQWFKEVVMCLETENLWFTLNGSLKTHNGIWFLDPFRHLDCFRYFGDVNNKSRWQRRLVEGPLLSVNLQQNQRSTLRSMVKLLWKMNSWTSLLSKWKLLSRTTLFYWWTSLGRSGLRVLKEFFFNSAQAPLNAL